MNPQLLDAIIGAASLKDHGNTATYGAIMANKRQRNNHGNTATYGAIMANKRQRNKYLRKHHLGKFAKGKK